MTSDYRLIWFQHLHKAAGSSVVHLAEANHETLYPRHRNGNPVGKDGEPIRLWEMEPGELLQFVDHCRQEGVTFVATEWGAPDLKTLATDSRVRLITVLRDPLKRFLSNFYFDYYGGFTDRRSPEQYANSCDLASHTMFNYYCRVFSRVNEKGTSIGEDEFNRAESALAAFHHCGVLESRDCLSRLAKSMDWGTDNMHANSTRFGMRRTFGQLARGRIGPVWRRLRFPREKPSEGFARRFHEENAWDIRLYNQTLNGDK